MKTYEVEMQETVYYKIVFEAKDEDEAEELAWEKLGETMDGYLSAATGATDSEVTSITVVEAKP